MARYSLLAAAALFSLACDQPEPPGIPADLADAGSPAHDAGSAPSRRIVWPEPTMVIEGAGDPALVRSPTGTLTLVYWREGKLWAQRDPPAGSPIAIADAPSPMTELSVAASPTEDRIFVAYTGRSGVSLTAGQPDGLPYPLLDGLADLSGPGASWVDGRPVVSAFTNEVWLGSEQHPPSFLAFAVPIDSPQSMPLREPAANERIEARANAFHHYDEAHKLIDLGGGRALLFRTLWRPDPENGDAPAALWHHLAPRLNSLGDPTPFLVARRTGFLPLPSPAAWIQPHSLGDGKFALTWGASEGTLMYDVHVAGLALDEEGAPTLSTAPVNVSMTFGLTQNSDHPVIHPTGDGRFWIAWRETDFGPRVALLAEDGFRVTRLGGPTDELACDMASALGAQVDAQGTLHLVAGFNDDLGRRIAYFRIQLP